VCDLETLRNRRPKHALSRRDTGKKIIIIFTGDVCLGILITLAFYLTFLNMKNIQ
jgi:hypothetical protein